MTTMSPGARTGRRILLDIGAEACAIDWSVNDARRGEPVATQPGTSGSAIGRRALWRRGACHWRSGHGFRSGLVDEEEPPRIDRRLTRLPPLTPPGDVRPVLFGAAKAFFERHAFMLEKMPKRVIADHLAAVGQPLKQSVQRDVRLLGDPRKNPVQIERTPSLAVSAGANEIRPRTTAA